MENIEYNATYDTPDSGGKDGRDSRFLNGFLLVFGLDKIVILLVIIFTVIGVKFLTNHVTFSGYVLEKNLIVEGDNGQGVLSKPYDVIDIRSFYNDYSNGTLTYPEFAKLFDVSVEGDTENITHDTKLKFTIRLDKDKAEAAMNKKLLKSVYKYDYEASAYDKPMINPFKYLELTYEGTEGNASAKITTDESQSNQYGYTLKVKTEKEISGTMKDYLEIYKGSEYINSYEIEHQSYLGSSSNGKISEGDAIKVTLSQKTQTDEYRICSDHIVFVNALDEIVTEKQSINKESIEAFKKAAIEQVPDGKYLHTYFLGETKFGSILVATFEEPEYNYLHIADITNPGIDENGNIQQYSLDSIETDAIVVDDFNNLDINKELKNYYKYETSVDDAQLD